MAPVTELRPDLLITPSVRLLRPLGQGGMGSVWIGEHLRLSTKVVVKFMATDIAATADGAARFAREASVAAAVKSPHVVQVFDHGVTDDGEAYIVMELLEGRDLAAHLKASGPMSPTDVGALVSQVAKALGKAHQVGVVHRDIKPDNIFLCDGDGGELFVKLLDFGIAKSEQHRITSAATTTGAVVGTPYYMSPEQIIGDSKIDARTDIWSLGVVAFEAMTGKRPFDGATIGAITLAIHTTTPRITEHIPDAPEALDQWFAHVCARIPGDRFQSPREAAAALLETVGDLPSSLPRLRVPMPSMVGDAGATSSPNVAPSSDLQLATNLSSSASVHQDTNRRRPVLAVAVGATVLGLAVGLFTIPAWLAPRKPTVVGGATAPVAQRDPPTMTTPSSTAPPQPATSAALPASEVEPTEARAPASVTSAGTANTATQPRAPTSAKAPVKATKPAKPNRTRDDDDIK